jgi:hypothetical protein
MCSYPESASYYNNFFHAFLYRQVNILTGFNLQGPLKMYADLDCTMSVCYTCSRVPMAKDATPGYNYCHILTRMNIVRRIKLE